MTRRPGHKKYRTQVTVHTRAFKAGRQRLRLRLPAHTARLARRAKLVVVAFDRSGATIRRSRTITL
jgi:hypothetical protein